MFPYSLCGVMSAEESVKRAEDVAVHFMSKC